MAEIEKGFILIKGALLADASRRRGEPAEVLIEDGIIKAVGTEVPAPPGTKIIDAAGLLMHPGLINGHTHGHTGLGKGQGDKWTLELLLAAAPWIGGNRTTEDKKLSTMLCAAEMVAKGCTAAYDLFFEFPVPTVDGMDAGAAAYAEVGMRAVIAPMVADRSLYEAIPGLLDALPAPLRKVVEGMRMQPYDATLSASPPY